jgi:hypothetical protein
LDEEHCPRAAFFAYFFWLQQKSKLNEGIRLKNAMDCGERSEYLISAAHKKRSHKNKKTSLSSFLQIIRTFETLSKTHSLSTKSLEPQQSRQAASPMSI